MEEGAFAALQTLATLGRLFPVTFFGGEVAWRARSPGRGVPPPHAWELARSRRSPSIFNLARSLCFCSQLPISSSSLLSPPIIFFTSSHTPLLTNFVVKTFPLYSQTFV